MFSGRDPKGKILHNLSGHQNSGNSGSSDLEGNPCGACEWIPPGSAMPPSRPGVYVKGAPATPYRTETERE